MAKPLFFIKELLGNSGHGKGPSLRIKGQKIFCIMELPGK
jgi:hypothetical protein